MTALHFEPVPMDDLATTDGAPAHTDWLWDGYLARGNITLLTSMWKAGKTTLVAGVLRALATGGAFLDRPCAAGHALVVSEESAAIWAARRGAARSRSARTRGSCRARSPGGPPWNSGTN